MNQSNSVFFSEDDLLPISSLADLVFCERRAALHFLEGVWQENQFTAEGHILHEKTHEANTESRGNVRIVRGLRLRSLRLGLSGVADVVEFHRLDFTSLSDLPKDKIPQGVALAGTTGLWKPFPVEYKRGKLKHEKSYEIQLCGQALCLEEMMNVQTPVGAIFYGKSMRRHDVTFSAELRQETEMAARRMHDLIVSGRTPPPVYEKRCESCSLIADCLPKTIQKRCSVKNYLTRILGKP
ncbi:MAG: CRISPR-associated protein Cas4 [Deltaproteobacteria bacterium]|nr:CRISPR-associated protein Cas4 [Deltaproteobacteria bacterium]